ncbi:MAG: sugar transferase [Ilumatobacteraceae bacterium]
MSALELYGSGEEAPSVHPSPLHLVPQGTPRSRCVGWRWNAKRTFDIVAVSMMLPLLLPLMVALAILIKIMSRGPVMYRHERIGHHGETFQMLKFRTMFVDSGARLESDQALNDRYVKNDFKLPKGEDPRIVPLGGFLRGSSLDELPQLFNVLLGHMSLVGPRPIVAAELPQYGLWASAYVVVRPGMTGRWQTEGRNDIRYPERAMIDAEYVESWRLRSDVMILAKTLPCVMRRTGAQ